MANSNSTHSTMLIILYLVIASLTVQSTYYTSYMWHLQQPIYWPAVKIGEENSSTPTYQSVWDSFNSRSKQDGYPTDPLQSIFAKADRQAVYQYRAWNAVQTIMKYSQAGAQIDYPGDLIDNVDSLGQANQWGYSSGWSSTYANALNEKTAAGHRRLDIVNFPYHHDFAPLIAPKMLKMSLLTNQVRFKQNWNNQELPVGLFPAEMAFSERIIPTLLEAGVKWVIVPNNHISRACKNYSFSPPGDNNTPPNKADQINPAQSHWFVSNVNRGCRPNNAVPYSYTPHYAQHTDPDTGKVSKIIVVPSAMAMSWKDSESCYSTSDIDSVKQWCVDDSRPCLFLLAHDGDNAFSGGYSYYEQCVQQFVGQVQSGGGIATTVNEYLAQFPPPEDDVVHVEDGAWINHSSDFGDPQFIYGWSAHPFNDSGVINIPTGWNCALRQWAIINAAQNFVDTATQVIGKPLRPEMVTLPQSGATWAEIAFHFHQVQASGYLYYGCAAADMAAKPTISANNAVHYSKLALGGSFSDSTPPTIWKLQRFPYNPGGYGAGAIWHYKYTKMSRDFYVYSFVFDVSGIKDVTFYYRIDPDKEVSDENHLRFSKVGTGWQTKAMSGHEFSKTDPTGHQKFHFLPDSISSLYYVHLTGFENQLMDYYVQATDIHGNVAKSPIYHVWID